MSATSTALRRRLARLLSPSLRSLILAVAACAVVSAGLRGAPFPGLHYRWLLAPGVRFGACRNDAQGPPLYARGERGGPTYQVGAWATGGQADREGFLRVGVEVSGGVGVAPGRWRVVVVGPGGGSVWW